MIGVAEVAVAVRAFRPGNGPIARSLPTDAPLDEVTFPAEPIPVEGWKGHYSIPIGTTLPEGTMGYLEYKNELGEGGGCCESVVEGVIQAPLVNNRCVEKDGSLQGSKVTLQVLVAPNFGSMIYGSQGAVLNVPAQPESVLAVLGANFEYLDGPDVLVHGGTRMLVASSPEYQLPADTCVSPYSH